ncbi:MAG: hypothetical protein HY938_06545 [Nitrosomonadales bacterium]|nr:hypothetical protein [Nitrosomonadales bacterium]
MWIADAPTPNIDPPAIYLAANTVAAQAGGATHKLGVCRAINRPADITPTGNAEMYLYQFMHKDMNFELNANGSLRPDTSVRITEQPKHGKLVQEYPNATDYRKYHYKYIPDADYADYDHFVMEVTADGISVQIYYTMSVGLPGEPTYVVDENGQRTDDLSVCPKPYWKISAILNSDGTNTITSVEYQSPFTDAVTSTTDTAALASTLGSSILNSLSVDPSSVTFNIADLPNGAAGQVVGNTITLDDNAAGHNWFIDATPADNSEYLPTSNPYEWVAKEGSATYRLKGLEISLSINKRPPAQLAP